MRIAVVALAVAACRPPPAEPVKPPPAAPPLSAEQLVERMAEPGVTTPLDEVARAAALAASVDHVIPARTLREAMARRLGSGTWPHVLSAHGSDETVARLLASALAELQASTEIADLGSATASGPAGRVGILIALPPPHLPHNVERLGDVARIKIAVEDGLRDGLEVFAVTPSAAARLAVADAGDEGIAIDLDCARRGDAAVELHAGGRVVASIVDACGVPGVAARDDDGTDGPPARTRIEIEQRVFELVNRERLAHGLRALAWDADGQRFARAHSEDMARGRYVGHAGPAGETYEDRISAAKLWRSATHENVGHAWGPAEVHTAFMASPGHRRNLLAADVEHGSVGIVFDRDDAPTPGGFYITEFFRTIR
ncbi:MAG: hypothetical protein KF773_32480 [Deltaproteobacteria bacterium]|nr:hypothetical protein [Deltaproteobacteria bacterium]